MRLPDLMVETATGVVAIKDSALTLTALINIKSYIYGDLKQYKDQYGKPISVVQ